MHNLQSVLITQRGVFIGLRKRTDLFHTDFALKSDSNLKELLAKEAFKRAQLSDSENCSHKRRLCAYLQRQERTII